MHHFVLETPRLILRPLTVKDCNAVFQWVSDPLVAKYMVYPTYTSLEQTVHWLASLQNQNDEYHFGFERKEDSLLIGSGSISPDPLKPEFWSFGYNLRADCWGKGYATEALSAMIRFAYECYGISKFSSDHAEPNKASGRVMEKCGLHFLKYGVFQKLDGTCTMRSMEYEGEIDCFPDDKIFYKFTDLDSDL